MYFGRSTQRITMMILYGSVISNIVQYVKPLLWIRSNRLYQPG